jgi:hypothetical protein
MALSTVYHTPGLTAPIHARLYQAGFRDIDAKGESGLTPLMGVRWTWLSYADGLELDEGLSVSKWLITRGADPFCTISDQSPPALHYVAWGIGNRTRALAIRINQNAATTRHILLTRLSYLNEDSC